jgi:citrate lyase beta subunit
MSKTVFQDGDEGVRLIVKNSGKQTEADVPAASRLPMHVVYGGADRFRSDTPRKLGDIALTSIENYASNFVEFANAMGLPRTEELPPYPDAVGRLEEQILESGEKPTDGDRTALFAFRVYRKTIEKLASEPIEDFRIDFEDGYGIRPAEQEDADAETAARELGYALLQRTITSSSGFRIKPLTAESYGRAAATLTIFLDTLLRTTNGVLPPNFVVTLPKVSSRKEVKELCSLLKQFEKVNRLEKGSIGIELMIETPEAIIDRRGRVALSSLVNAGKGRVTSVHFGAYDYTSALGIAADHQHLRHPACDFARHLMLITLAPTGMRLADSVTTQMPVPIHKGSELSEEQLFENKRAVHAGWREHFRNVSRSLANGFYQSWDLHPNQLVARYAAIYSFFFSSADAQAARLRKFLEQATQATLTGSTFDDAASVRGILNFFSRGLDCSAFSEDEVKELTGLSASEIRSGAFLKDSAR